ncbi:hypothetical protein Bhyg_03212 [Pseudolycoriella hygida]|uniref:Uncharacterized protein n=1 Tax=Pseudolycoriella hygida TaxID=35572 RepID=A0A9Q0NCW2_9DIPT|nr:hypothetical protein Bhyg_03212 [Pseudolycoriella hygida]
MAGKYQSVTRNYDKYFEFVKAKSEKSVLVQCLLCPPRKQLVCTINSAYNLTVHIKSSHHQDVKQFTERTQKRKIMEILPSNDSSESKRRQTTIDKFSEGGSITQARLDRLVFNYIIDKVQPFSIVQSESFKEMRRDFLPPQKRCASHSLCLVLTTDIKLKKPKKKKNAAPKLREKELTASEREFNEFRETVLDPVLEKCQKLFNKQSNSPKAADLVHNELLDEKPKEMESVMTGFGLEKFYSRDREILKEYIEVTRNVADALDVLQGEVYMYQGVFSPTIHNMKQKINDLTDLKFCLPLKERILKSVEKRRHGKLSSEEHSLAASAPRSVGRVQKTKDRQDLCFGCGFYEKLPRKCQPGLLDGTCDDPSKLGVLVLPSEIFEVKPQQKRRTAY